MPKGSHQKIMWEWMSRKIRLRDTDDDGKCTCPTCGTRLEPKYMDAGHVFRKGGKFKRLEFDERFIFAQCKACNNWGMRDPDVIQKYEQHARQIHGDKTVDMALNLALVSVSQLRPTECGFITEQLKKEVKELLEKKRIIKWW